MKSFAKVLQLGFVIIGCILFGLFIGFLLDKYFDMSPLFKIIGLLVGTLEALLYLFNLAKNERL